MEQVQQGTTSTPQTNGTPRTRPLCVMLAVPYERDVSGPFFQSWTATLAWRNNEIVFWPYLVSRTVIHLARDQMVKAALSRPEVDYLLMVDSDQVFGADVIARLVRHHVPVVAPVIVQRGGPAIPVAYREVLKDSEGWWRYDPLAAEIGTYLSQYREDRLLPPSVCLPRTPDHPPVMEGIPDVLAAGLHDPLLRVDALGTGMLLIRRDVLESLEPDPTTHLYFDFVGGGEDFYFCRKVREAGWGGMTTDGTRGPGLFVDRGCLVGHVTNYARAGGDLLEYLRQQDREERAKEAEDAARPPAVPDLVQVLERDARTAPHSPWADVELPAFEQEGVPV